MLKFTDGTRTFRISWEHVDSPILRGSNCIISEEVGGKRGPTVAFGSSTCHPKDRFDKEVGRKVSLASALATWIPRENLKLRKHIWFAYFSRCNVGKECAA